MFEFVCLSVSLVLLPVERGREQEEGIRVCLSVCLVWSLCLVFLGCAYKPSRGLFLPTFLVRF
jgi:hypothetical protein